MGCQREGADHEAAQERRSPVAAVPVASREDPVARKEVDGSRLPASGDSIASDEDEIVAHDTSVALQQHLTGRRQCR